MFFPDRPAPVLLVVLVVVVVLLLLPALCLCCRPPILQIRWRSSASADLPLGQEACARRLAFFKRKPQIKAFIDNLQAQVRHA
jgi:hypothetical protein